MYRAKQLLCNSAGNNIPEIEERVVNVTHASFEAISKTKFSVIIIIDYFIMLNNYNKVIFRG